MNKKLFDVLVMQWEEDVKFSSSSHEIFAHPNYQLIVAEGKSVLPLIFEEMEKGKSFWGHAVEKIVGQKIIPAEIYGRMELMRDYILNWAKLNGYR